MVSVHTFEMKAALSKAEQEKIKKKLEIPGSRQNWTEHRYNNRGIQIILYKGKSKGFIYIKYIINLKRIFDGADYLHLLEPTDGNLSQVWKTIIQTWNEIGCGIPFYRFYLSRIDFTCDIPLKNEELLHEYIRLLSKSILLPSSKKFPVDGIYHGKEISNELKCSLQKNCCKFVITTCENIQFYNKIYELENEGLPIPEDIINCGNSILRIELQIHKTKRITELLQLFHMHNDPIDKQFSFLIRNADTFLISRLGKIYAPGKYYKKPYIMSLINNDFSVKRKSRERAIRLVEDCNKNTILGRYLELDKRNGNLFNRKKALEYLSNRKISPVAINSCLKDYDVLPDIFGLVNKEHPQLDGLAFSMN